MGSFWLIIVVVLSFGVTVVCGQNGLLSARCAARCLKEHRDSLRGGSDRNNHRKMIDRCKNYPACFQCVKPCAMSYEEIKEEKCANHCRVNETQCELSCRFLLTSYKFKAGSCPQPETAVGFEAVCLQSCSVDGDCEDALKCCPNECGVTCRQPDFTTYSHILPPIPSNLSYEERRQRKSLNIKWSLPDTETMPRGILYVVEHRNTTSVKPSWNHDTPWTTLLWTNSRGTLIRRIPAGHWFQYRVAAVTGFGSQGYYTSPNSFKSSRAIGKPSPPQNLTEGATTLRKGQVDVMIHWKPPAYSDLPVWKYTIIWSERLSTISPVLVRLQVLEKTVPGHITKFKLKNLKPATTYSVQIEAIVQHGNRQLRSKLASHMITTYSPPNPKPDMLDSLYGHSIDLSGQYGNLDETITRDKTDVISIYKDVIRVQRLHCSDAYFHQGGLKAFLTWKVGKAFVNIVKSYMIYWIPQSCDQDYAELQPLSATSHVTSFEVYDLQFECQYVLKVSAVTKKGVQGRPASTKLKTPVCKDIEVKSDSLPPDCPEREPQVPRSPDSVLPKIVNNCTIDLHLSWGQPASDLPIDEYRIKYGIAELFKKRKSAYSDEAFKSKPVVIRVDSILTNYTLKNLKESEHYVIQIFAQSAAGLGEPAYVEIWTPEILPCGSDKDPVPPDISRPVTMYSTTQSLPVGGSTDEVGVAIFKTTTSINRTHVDNRSSKDIYITSNNAVNIYRTVYYLFFIIYKLILRS